MSKEKSAAELHGELNSMTDEERAELSREVDEWYAAWLLLTDEEKADSKRESDAAFKKNSSEARDKMTPMQLERSLSGTKERLSRLTKLEAPDSLIERCQESIRDLGCRIAQKAN